MITLGKASWKVHVQEDQHAATVYKCNEARSMLVEGLLERIELRVLFVLDLLFT